MQVEKNVPKSGDLLPAGFNHMWKFVTVTAKPRLWLLI